jgi:pimeloyl-ACP methyl ester carboxylesterase
VAGRARLITPLIAIHGFADSGECMRPFLQRVGRPDAHAPNLLAHGGRPMPPGVAFSHDELVADMLTEVRRVSRAAGRPVAMLGHSLGASTAAGVAAAAPDLVCALVLEDPPWQVPANTDRAADEDNSHRPWLEGLRSTDHEGRHGWLQANNPGWPIDELDPWAHSKVQVDLALFDAEQHWLRRSWPSVVRDVACPTLLMVGDPRRGAACAPDVADALSGRPGWTVRRIDGAGHNLRREQPSAVAALVGDALGEAA